MNSRQLVIIYESSSRPYGKSYEEWTTLWWKWFISIPRNRNPAFDLTGQFSSTSQNNRNVWFLAGTLGGSTTRKFTIPHGKSILFPVINYECSFTDEPLLKTEKELEKRCRSEIDQITNMSASLDGEAIDLLKYRVESRCFPIYIPPENCLGVVSGTTSMASDGYWLFIEPLSHGKHVLKSFGSCLAGKIKIGCTFQIVIE